MSFFDWIENNKNVDRSARLGLIVFVFITVFIILRLETNSNTLAKELMDARTQLAITQEDVRNLQTETTDIRTTIERQEEIIEELKVDMAVVQEDLKAVINEVEWLKVAYQFLVVPGKLTRSSGVAWFEGHKETFYNLDMTGVINWARIRLPEDMRDWEYWIREEDGLKMYGDYVIVAADQSIHPYGSLVMTSLGVEGIVLDTGTFIYSNSEQIDIATNW